MTVELSAAPTTVSTEPQRKGDWMQVASGRAFWPFDPRADEICIEDIAHGLSMLCRFGGHVQRFYSVAEHSVWCSRIVPPKHALQALMHDSTEAYCVDIPRPLKRGLSNYAEIEAGIWSAVCDRFDLVADLDATVKVADNAMCLAEARQIMTRPEIDWSATGEAAAVTVECWSPEEGRRRFLERFAELTKPQVSGAIDWTAPLIDSNGKPVHVTMTPEEQYLPTWAGHYDVRVGDTDEHRTVRADTGLTPDGDYSVSNAPAGSCFLCAGKCRGHGLADPVAWEPEVGSVAALARAKAHAEGDAA